MRLGMIGLGRMGMNMVRRLLQGDHEVVAGKLAIGADGDVQGRRHGLIVADNQG